MSHNRKIKQPDTELNFDIEIMKVKQEQLEKRLDLLEKTLSFYERTHRAEIMTLFSLSEKRINKNNKNNVSSESDESEVDNEVPVEKEEKSESRKNINNHLRTIG